MLISDGSSDVCSSDRFSGAPNPANPENHDAAPNTLVAPVDMGLPGALPVVNEQAVRSSISLGLALGCSIAPSSRFARKNYFYPDLGKNYQISQYDEPIAFERSEERRVGKKGVSTGKSRGAP